MPRFKKNNKEINPTYKYPNNKISAGLQNSPNKREVWQKP